MKMRQCLRCGRRFASAGPHHRICRTCKRVRPPDEPEPEDQLDSEASRARREQGLRRLMGLPVREPGLARFFVGARQRFGTCQWIAGEPSGVEACKCGRPALRGSPYCAPHAARARLETGA